MAFSQGRLLFPKGQLPKCKFPEQNFPKVRLRRRPQRVRALLLEKARGPSATARTDLRSYRLRNCTFGKLPLGKQTPWENTIGKLPLGKNPLGKYLTSIVHWAFNLNFTPICISTKLVQGCPKILLSIMSHCFFHYSIHIAKKYLDPAHNKFEPRLKSAKNWFQLNLKTLNSRTNHF